MDEADSGVLLLVLASEPAAAHPLIHLARQRQRAGDAAVFPRRIVSGPPICGTEVHQTVTPAQFEELRRNGAFGLVWGSAGRNFALPASIAEDLHRGRVVVAAAAQMAVPVALRAYPRVALALGAGVGEEVALRDCLDRCEDAIHLGDDPAEAGGALAAYIEDLAGTARPRRRGVESSVGRPIT